MRIKIIAIICIAGLVLILSCSKSDSTCTKEVAAERLSSVDQTRLTNDVATIDAYLTNQNIVAEKMTNGMRYIVTSLGTGEMPCLESRITFKYKGNLFSNPSGTPFDQSTTGVTYTLSGLILGWQLVLPLMPAGSKLTLYIPSGYAYGSSVSANGKIPANSILIFEMELVAVY